MKELTCPKCGNVFTVDEADYASILSQVKNQEFAAELARRNLSLAIWTVDDVETAEYFINTVKPEAITSNRAAYLQGVIDLGKER